MVKRLLIFLTLLCIYTGVAMAQTRVNGTVTSADGEPIVGAAVKVLGTNTGTVTDVDGRFNISVPSGSTLRISYLGMKPKELKASANMKILLEEENQFINEVVVTALGISRQEKTLGYSAQTLKDAQLTEGHVTDVTSALAGKVSGVQINSTSGDPGQANSVIIRGISSINGNNQPLYVVDGVPLQQTTSTSQEHTVTMGGISNVNPDDIASMTVLKGAAATALYGSRAANGVIIITTKTGQKGNGGRNFSISYSGGVQARTVATLPEFQNEFGQGWNGQQTYIENGSWGPAFDGSTQVYGPIYNHQQLIHTYSAAKNNVKDFFDTGLNTNHSIALSGVSDDNKMTYYVSYGYTYDNGIIPRDKDTYNRHTLGFRGSYQPTKWLKVSSSVNVAKSNTNTVGSFQGTSMIDGIYELPRDVSLVDKQDLSSPFNTPTAYFTPYGITNPYWAIENNYNHTDNKQVFGKVQADIYPVRNVTFTYRYGFDYTDYDQKVGEPQIDVDDTLIDEDYGYSPTNMNQNGYVFSRYYRKHEYNHDFILNWHTTYLDKRLDVNVNAGANINERYYTYMTGQTSDLTFYSGYWNLSNGATKDELSEYSMKRRSVGAFTDATFGWDDMLYLDLTARNDWSSTLPTDDNSYFYPGATLSWIFTKLIPENKVLTFGKLRMAYGRTGNDANPYLTKSTYVQAYANGYYGTDIAKFPMNGVNAFQASSTKGSTSLKPEMTTEFEIGTNLVFFDNRINLDFAYYHRVTKDQIFTLPIDPASGYSYEVVNFGKVRNQGIELLLNTVPVQTRDFKWELGFNFSKNNNKVLSMPSSLEGGRTVINSFSAGNDAVYMYAEEGKAIGELYTYLPTYTDDGKLIVDSNGLPVLTTSVEDTGKNVNYDWTGGVTTALSYKGFTLSAALDIRKGGYMFSRTKNLMQFSNGKITTYNGRNPFVIPNSVVQTGTDADGNPIYETNTTPLYMTDGSYQDYFNNYGAGLGGEFYLIDRSYVKLRNVTLTWNLPRPWVRALSLSDISLSIFANNLFTWTASDNLYIDPETSSYDNDLEGMFGELYSNPGCRTFGFNLNVKF
jgi:TonB-linked SusC/RagA family outer membrane protein